jgi:uncharacterized damage-inducible protein DinB
MSEKNEVQLILKELEAEAVATRKCLEKIPESKFDYKPHEKSMNMRYLALIVAEIPLWIKHMVEGSEIDFVTFSHIQANTTSELVAHFDENMAAAKKALNAATDKMLDEPFTLKANGQLLYTTPKRENIGPSINHWVHHRGQLTVYMRLNDIPVPSIYGPSADEQGF